MGLFRHERLTGHDRDGTVVLAVTGRWPTISITYGDHEIPNVVSLTLYIEHENLPEVHIVLRPDEIEVDAECQASIEAAFQRRAST